VHAPCGLRNPNLPISSPTEMLTLISKMSARTRASSQCPKFSPDMLSGCRSAHKTVGEIVRDSFDGEHSRVCSQAFPHYYHQPPGKFTAV
jgi:hypothetical protein